MMREEVPMLMLRTWRLVAATALVAIGISAPAAAQMSRAQALQALEQPAPAARLAGVERLADVGLMADAEQLAPRLRDAAPAVRERAASALWQIWGRSGDPAIDGLYARGVAQMEAAELTDALATFNEIVRRRPAFAEGWNKRATIYFLLGRYAESLKDVDEVLQRNRHHFGALSGAGQIHLQLGNERLALEFFQRALAVNPNLDGLDRLIPLLEERVRKKSRNAA
jgi:tetratricopeptide (TPR) repeat protein